MKFDVNLGSVKASVDLTPVEEYLKALPKLIRAFLSALVHPEVPGWLKVYAIAGITYFYSPLDIVPDFFTGIGFVDDTILALLIMQTFLSRLDETLLRRILRADETDPKAVFFNVREGTEAFAKFFASLYKTIKGAYQNLIQIYGEEQKKQELSLEADESLKSNMERG